MTPSNTLEYDVLCRIENELKRMNELKEIEILLNHFQGNGSYIEHSDFMRYCQQVRRGEHK